MSATQSADSTSALRPHKLILAAALHGFFWLFVANIIGTWLALLLLVPAAGNLLGELSYGRWVIVHLNLQLYGWTSLPLVGWLFHIYSSEKFGSKSLAKSALWLWSAALFIGSCSWLSGNSSGKLFLDWSGYARTIFALALFFLWLVLTATFIRKLLLQKQKSILPIILQAIGILILMLVPFTIYFASSPTVYPPINPSTGGPTGASQLESSLGIVLILMLLPLGLLQRKTKNKSFALCWILLLAHFLFCASMGRTDSSHHLPLQHLGFASLIIWAPLIVLYFNSFAWPPVAAPWRSATLFWWFALLIVGLTQYFPGILDHYKFTDGLVAHSLMAMAGFTTSLLILVIILLLGERAAILNRPWSFWLWHIGTALYIALMLISGWIEGSHPAFTFLPGPLRNLLFILRLIAGAAMTLASADWFFALFAPNFQFSANPFALKLKAARL